MSTIASVTVLQPTDSSTTTTSTITPVTVLQPTDSSTTPMSIITNMSAITSVVVFQPTPTMTVSSSSTPIVLVTISTGAVITTILYSPTPTNTYGSDSTTSSNTGDIVGGVVGGIAAICLLAFLLFYVRRHRRRIVSFSAKGRMPPQRVGNNIAPFPHPERDVNQYGDNPNLPAGASDGVGREKSHLNTALQPPDLSTHNYPHDARPLSWEIYQPFVVRPSTRPHTQGPDTYAMSQTNRYNPRMQTTARCEHDLASRQEVDSGGSGVVQHQDAGHVPSESGEVLLRDIPPTYESILQ